LSAASARSKKVEFTGWAHFGRSLHVSQMTANWGRAAFQADEYILGIIVNFVGNKLPFSVTWLACSSGFFP
jgi:hypothetical protein